MHQLFVIVSALPLNTVIMTDNFQHSKKICIHLYTSVYIPTFIYIHTHTKYMYIKTTFALFWRFPPNPNLAITWKLSMQVIGFLILLLVSLFQKVDASDILYNWQLLKLLSSCTLWITTNCGMNSACGSVLGKGESVWAQKSIHELWYITGSRSEHRSFPCAHSWLCAVNSTQ